MSRIAFATCSPRRAGWEDDRLAAEVLSGAGCEVGFLAWDDPDARWQDYDRVVVRSTWDYTGRIDEFREWADRVGGDRLRNSPEMIRWNTDKRYLAELDGAGLPVPPTLLVTPDGFVPGFGGEVVVKPVTGAGARYTGRFGERARDGALELIGRIGASGGVAMVQPYIRELEEYGETAVLVFGGRVAYALRKNAFLPPDSVAPADASGVALAMSDEALVSLREPLPEEVDLARRTVTWLASRFGRTPLYARVDMVRTGSGDPVLMEVELTEPSFYLSLADGLPRSGAEAFAGALLADLG
jgi:glutathione synthase/RimK-type ligase-like ATP-grasp enzyme